MTGDAKWKKANRTHRIPINNHLTFVTYIQSRIRKYFHLIAMKIHIAAVVLLLSAQESHCFSIGGKQRFELPIPSFTTSHNIEEFPVQSNGKFHNESKIKTFGKALLERSDTLNAAGFNDPAESEYPPLQAGAKTNITLFLLALGYKWYRSIFINKVSGFRSHSQERSVVTVILVIQ